MSDLISRDALLEDLRSTITEQSDTLDWINMINRQPTAYDLDKVVQQLEDRSTLSRPVGWTKSYEIITLDAAVEIVKGGGADE